MYTCLYIRLYARCLWVVIRVIKAMDQRVAIYYQRVALLFGPKKPTRCFFISVSYLYVIELNCIALDVESNSLLVESNNIHRVENHKQRAGCKSNVLTNGT